MSNFYVAQIFPQSSNEHAAFKPIHITFLCLCILKKVTFLVEFIEDKSLITPACTEFVY